MREGDGVRPVCGRRYRDRPVIFIWVVIATGDRGRPRDRACDGGRDRGVRSREPDHVPPARPGRSSDVFHREDWLDFDMIQSSHAGRGADTGLNVEHDRALQPPSRPWTASRVMRPDRGLLQRGGGPCLRFDDYDVRVAAYRASSPAPRGTPTATTTCGRCGRAAGSPSSGPTLPGPRLSTHAGAFQMGRLRRLFSHALAEARAHTGPRARTERVRRWLRARGLAQDRSFAFVYSRAVRPVAVDQGRLGAVDVTSWWFDPRYGRAYKMHTGVGTAVQFFTRLLRAGVARLDPRARRRVSRLLAAR